MISENAIIHKNVKIGKNVHIEDFCIIGKPASSNDSKTITVIGDNALIRSHTVIYAGNIIGEGFSTGHHVVIREDNRIGDNVSIGTGSCIEHHIRIENGVRLHSQVFVPEFSKLEEQCWVGPNVVITNAKYPQGQHVKENLKGATLCRKSKIGANATLLPGVTIGKNTLIGAGSVVSRDIKENLIAVGNPAKVIKKIDEIEDYKEHTMGEYFHE